MPNSGKYVRLKEDREGYASDCEPEREAKSNNVDDATGHDDDCSEYSADYSNSSGHEGSDDENTDLSSAYSTRSISPTNDGGEPAAPSKVEPDANREGNAAEQTNTETNE